MLRRAPPTSLPELEARAAALTGLPLARLAAELDSPVPADLRRAKGWVGQLVEAALGAEGGSHPEPDFDALGVELKTIPVGRDGGPRESTFVCTAPIEGAFEASWETSRVRRKLARVLWVPIAGDRGEPPGARTIGAPRLWVPSPVEDAALAGDWLQLSELIAGGELHRIHGRLGAVLQLRPKAANAADYAWMLDEEGAWVRSVPFGFYLRARFTRGVLGA
ncbi:MAG: DNA mismatch repair endonuclease MutH [Pseudomonadota bacterium]|nr:DNA mismatch repair endonuclease MutH [Pseudomonadota bacterium]